MSTSIRSRLLISTLSVILPGMVLVSILVWRSVENTYLDTQRVNLLAQARLSAAALSESSIPFDNSQAYSQAANVMPGIHTRFLADQGGIVVSYPILGEELTVPDAEQKTSVTAGELAQRPEIRQALQGEAAAATRKVGSAGGRRVLYAAAPVFAPDGSITDLVYLATPLPAGGIPVKTACQLAGAILAAVLLAAAVGIILSQRLARPIERAADAALAVSSGKLDRRLSETSRITELDELGKAFNAMTTGLQQAEQVRNGFIADVTHELRTPLTVIKGTIETLEDGAVDDPVGRGPLLGSMQQETDRLIRLVNDLLILTRADAGALHLNMQPLDMVEVFRSRCDRLNVLASKKKVHLKLESVPANEIWVRGDPDRLAQVWDNLLENAIRYSPEGETVTVSIHIKKNEIVCRVGDRGAGLSGQHLEHIFERFYRADPSRDRKSGGAGLGLAIAHALVLAHQGSIRAESEQGKGTAIIFSLPAAPEDAQSFTCRSN